AIDDHVHRDLPGCLRDLVEHQRTKEMGVGLAASGLVVFQHRDDVVPERLPLQLLVPHIGALVKRNDVPDVELEELRDGARIGSHGAYPQRGAWHILVFGSAPRLTNPTKSAATFAAYFNT